jgi:hypothetical protein
VRRLSTDELDDLVAQYGCWDDASKGPTAADCGWKGLSALEITPDGGLSEPATVRIDFMPDGSTTTYECSVLAGRNGQCNGTITKSERGLDFALYRLSPGATPAWSKSGVVLLPKTTKGRELAEGTIDHFSIHVLVLLPADGERGIDSGDWEIASSQFDSRGGRVRFSATRDGVTHEIEFDQRTCEGDCSVEPGTTVTVEGEVLLFGRSGTAPIAASR